MNLERGRKLAARWKMLLFDILIQTYLPREGTETSFWKEYCKLVITDINLSTSGGDENRATASIALAVSLI